MPSTTTGRALLGAALLTLAACGAATTTPGAGTAAPTSSPTVAQSAVLTPSTATSVPTAAPAAAPSSAPAAPATVLATTVRGHNGVLVVASSGRTLYLFSKDRMGSGSSACTGSCVGEWPPLTVPAGTTPSAPGIPGRWGTLTRHDGGGIQVTYNGSPLYLFAGDSKAGDLNGSYPLWTIATASGGTASSGTGAMPSATPSSPY